MKAGTVGGGLNRTEISCSWVGIKACFHNFKYIFIWVQNHQFFSVKTFGSKATEFLTNPFSAEKKTLLLLEKKSSSSFSIPDIIFTSYRNQRCEIFGFFSSRSLKTREKCISFAQLVLLSLYIFWGKCVYFSIFEW